MKILFIGTVEFSYATLEKLISLNANIVGVGTKNQSPFNADFADLASLCEKNKLRLRYIQDINSKSTVEWIKSLQPDVIFCFGWSYLLKSDVLNSAPIGVIGFHPAELPQNRGRHPLIWALALGLHRTASTFFFMKQGADSGDILSQSPVLIDYADDARSLYDKVTQTALMQIEEFLPRLQKGNYTRYTQDQNLGNIWRKRSKTDGKIDFRMQSRMVYNLVRALTRPYVGAHVEYNGREIKIWQVAEEYTNLPHIEPGKIVDIRDGVPLVKCSENAVWLKKHEFNSLPCIGEYFV
jgi:methionyl-tRNA formyltransferase